MTQPNVRRETIPESYDLPHPLGRHIHHDQRSSAFPFASPAQLAVTSIMKTLWPVRIPVLDQAQVGSCTGEAGTYALATDDVDGVGLTRGPTGSGAVAVLDQAYAYGVYHNNTVIDGFPGTWEPDDTGSSGLATAQTLRSWGVVSSYQHCRSLGELLAALQRGPVLFGSNWYDSMFYPDDDGLVDIAPGTTLAGGHEYLIIGVDDPATQTVDAINSWGDGWGVNGRFKMSYATVDRLLSEDGDAIVMNVIRIPGTPIPEPPIPAWFTRLEQLFAEILDWFKSHLGQTR